MKYLIWAKVLLVKMLIYKAGIYLALIVLTVGAIYGNMLLVGLAVALYGMIAIAFGIRKYTRNTVYNYALQNDVWLPRLLEREPKLIGDKYVLKDIHHVKERNTIEISGYIKYRKISKLEYLLARPFWKWVDDDSNHDTMNGGDRTAEGMVYGNTFDLGDARGEYPQFKLWESWLWFKRNTGYNANYMDEECAEGDSKYFYYLTKEKHWTPTLKKWNGIPYIAFYKTYWHFGYIPYNNSTRQGRMVWFTEDISRID